MANIAEGGTEDGDTNDGNDPTISQDEFEDDLRRAVEEDQQRSQDITGGDSSGDTDGGDTDTTDTGGSTGDGLNDAERQNVQAAFEEEVEDFGQGVETRDQRAQEFEEEITSTSGQLDQVQNRISNEFGDTDALDVERIAAGRYRAEITTESGRTVTREYRVADEPGDVRVDREGDSLVASYTASGLEDIGANPTDEEIKAQVAAESEFTADELQVTRTGNGVSVSVTDAARNRRESDYENYLDGIRRLAQSDEVQFEQGAEQSFDEINQERIRGMSLRTTQRQAAGNQRRQRVRDTSRGLVETGVGGVFGSFVGPRAGDALADQTFDRVDEVSGAVAGEFGAIQDRARERYYGLPGVPSPEEADRLETSFYSGVRDVGSGILDANRNLENLVQEREYRTGPGPLALFPAAPSGVNAPSRIAGTVNRFRGTSGLRNVDPAFRAANVGSQASRGVAGAGGSASGGSVANIIGRLNARDAALIAGGIGAASTQVNVPENNDVFGPEIDVTGEDYRTTDIEVPADGEFSQTDISVPEDPTATRSEFDVTDNPAFEQPELTVGEGMSNAGFTLSELVQMPLSEQVERRRRRRRYRDDPVSVPEEFIPDGTVVIGETDVTEPEVEEPQYERDFSQPGRISQGVVGQTEGQELAEEAAEPQVREDEPLDVREETLQAPNERVAVGADSLQEEAQRSEVLQRNRLDTLQEPGLRQRQDNLQLPRMGLNQQMQLRTEAEYVDELVFEEQTRTGVQNQFGEQYGYQYGYEYGTEFGDGVDYGYGGEPPERPREPELESEDMVDVFESGRGVNRNPGTDPFFTFGYVSETFEGFAEGGLEPVEAPSQDVLAELADQDPGADLPTQDILSGEVDVEPIQDFFTIDEVEL